MPSVTDKAIITCAITGAVHTPTMSDALPFTPEDIAQQAIDAAHAGAAILHLHARDPRDGRPSADPAVFLEFLPQIAAATDAVINITTGGNTRMTLSDRLAAAHRVHPELASLNMGSMNFVFADVADRFEQWKYDWEKEHLTGSRDVIFSNTYSQIEQVIAELEPYGTRFEFECYDVGHLYTLAYFADRGLVRPPFFVQAIFGVVGGIGADPINLTHMVTVADKLFGTDYRLSAFGAGKHQFSIATQAAALGGNLRVGLEDGLYLSRGVPATSNAEQVVKAVRILHELGRSAASPDEARVMLDLKGPQTVLPAITSVNAG